MPNFTPEVILDDILNSINAERYVVDFCRQELPESDIWTVNSASRDWSYTDCTLYIVPFIVNGEEYSFHVWEENGKIYGEY